MKSQNARLIISIETTCWVDLEMSDSDSAQSAGERTVRAGTCRTQTRGITMKVLSRSCRSSAINLSRHAFALNFSYRISAPAEHLRKFSVFCQTHRVENLGQSTAFPQLIKRLFSTPQTHSRNGSGSGEGNSQGRNAPIELLSDVVVNVMTGERMPMKDYRAMADELVLRVLVDGSKAEMTLAEAVSEAEELDLDAVLVAANANPLVVKLMDHGKVRHDRNKKQKAAVKKSQSTCTKELRLGLRIGQHDLDVKLKQAREFMEKGHRVKLFIQLRGAEFYNAQQQACEKVEEVAGLLSNVATRESAVTMLGKIASVVMVPGAPKKPAQPTPPKRPSESAAAAGPSAATPTAKPSAPAAQRKSGRTVPFW